MFKEMLTKLLGATVVVLVGLSLVSFTYQDQNLGFSVDLPETWELGPSKSPDMMVAMSQWEGGDDQFRENMNVIVTSLDSDYDLQTLYNLNLANAKDMLSDFKALEVNYIEIGGVPAIQLVYSFKYENTTLKNMVYLLVDNQTMYTMTFATLEPRYDEFVGDFESIANSLRINNQAQ